MNPLKSDSKSIEKARCMLDAFASVGATYFDVTFLDIDGRKRGFRPQQSTRGLKHSLPLLFPGLMQRQNSLVVRPVSDTTTLIQLDDLNAETLAPLRAVSFLSLRTSPGNFQSWVAVTGLGDPKDFARRFRKGTHADISASGATRVAGTLNFKRKYEPNFPTVTIAHANPGLVVTPEQLHAPGLVAAEEPPRVPPRVSPFRSRHWPDYRRCVEGAPPNHGNTGPDVSRADFLWAMMAAQRGKSIDAIAERLMELSPKAQENGELYARRTAANAAEAAIRRDARRAR